MPASTNPRLNVSCIVEVLPSYPIAGPGYLKESDIDFVIECVRRRLADLKDIPQNLRVHGITVERFGDQPAD